MPICPSCNVNEAIEKPPYGWLPCNDCINRQRGFRKPKQTVEMTTEAIRQSRVEYEPDIVQPFREGVLNKRYLDVNGTKGIKVTKEDIKNAKYVYGEHKFYKEGDH